MGIFCLPTVRGSRLIAYQNYNILMNFFKFSYFHFDFVDAKNLFDISVNLWYNSIYTQCDKEEL